ncbi:hypothetical protein K491DRAFT_669096 [Lophiostoma macrostomum CBS 122681]|uniref:Uncharacterized protein n=1 Tax=Lophiostoma macrostomum CBS 122681 TaxID=1314788 RepID=A0A6A6SN85_9PLEO|nr:hypothetical protein K491DRAFT_669096 [Lophiostoma macrostomum CBS 122681]
MPASRPPHLHSRNASRAQHQRNKTAPEAPTLLRAPSDISVAASASVSARSRRSSNPTTPNLTQSVPTPSASSPSYFSPQSAASGKDARSPALRRPPASFSSNGIDNSRGPPITLISRGSRSQRPADFAFAQQQLLQLGLVSPGGTSHSSGGQRRRRASESSGDGTPHMQTPTLSRQNSTRAPKHMASSADGSSAYGSGMRSQSEDTHAARNGHGGTDTSSVEGEHGEDLFIAAGSAARDMGEDAPSRADKLRSRIAIRNNRQSLPSPVQSSSTTPQASRLPSAIDTGASGQHRRASHLSSASRTQREQSPLSPHTTHETPRSRLLELSPKPSFSSSKARDQDLSPQQFLSTISKRRPSYPDSLNTPPNRAQAYRPSNLHYSTSRNNPETPHVDTPQENRSRHDGTESLDDSTGPAASVWDELDDLKARLRRIEQGGKIPTTSAAALYSHVQVNGGSPPIRPSIEPESDTLSRDIPSRAMSRIEARRTSLMIGGANGDRRDSSLEPPTPSQTQIPSRLNRAGTSLHRTRRSTHDEDEDLTLRAPSRAMTDFRDIRSSNNTKRFSREYTPREPMPELQPSPSLQHTTSVRRPTVSGIENNHLPFRDSNRRYNLDRQSSPAYEKQVSNDLRSRLAQPQNASNRSSLGASGLGRTGSLSRRLRGASAGE